MGGSNPYIDDVEAELPTEKYEITFVAGDTGEERTVEADPSAFPYGHDGLPGSILDIALGAGIEIDHACGGVCACSTCHVVVEQGLDSCQESTDDEEDMLDMAPGLTEQSRLACQCIPNGKVPVRVVIPDWNRNLVSEEH